MSLRKSAAATVERVGRAARAADAAVARAGRPLVAGGHDDEGVEPRSALDGACDRAVREGGERLGHADDRDPRRVEHVAVGVGIDGALDPGQQLVGAAVDGEAALGARLPAGDADRQDPRGGDDAVDPARAASAGDQPGQLGSVPLEPRRLVRVRAGDPAALGVEHVEPVQQPVADERMRDVDAGVEKRDGDAAAVEARDADLRAAAPAGRERVARAAPRARERSRVGGPNRIDAEHVRVPLEQRERASVDRRREAVERARVDEVRHQLDALAREPRGDLLLRRQCPGRPLAHRRLGRRASGLGHPVGERRVLEHDDHPLADRDRGAVAVDEPAPRGRAVLRPRRATGRSGRRPRSAARRRSQARPRGGGGQARDAYASRSR